MYQDYLNDIFTDAYNKILPLVESLNKKGVCPCCGGIFLGGVCKYCHTPNSSLQNNVQKIENILTMVSDSLENLPIERVEYNELFTLLLKIKNVKIDIVDKLIAKYHYEEVIKKIYEQIVSKGYQGESLDKSEISVSEALISQNYSFSRDKDVVFNLASIYIKKIILNFLKDDKESVISYDFFADLIKEFMEEQIKFVYQNSNCEIKEGKEEEEENMTFGAASYNNVTLYDYDIKTMYYEGSEHLLNTIFHEFTHVRQYGITYKKKCVSPFEFLELKEEIISKFVPFYYKENYEHLSYELEAFYCGFRDERIALSNIGISLNEESNKRVDAILKEYEDAFLNTKRTLHGKNVDINQLFENVLKSRSFLLNNYPCLKNLYKIENGKVVRKTNEELQRTLAQILSDDHISEEDKNNFRLMFNLDRVNHKLTSI